MGNLRRCGENRQTPHARSRDFECGVCLFLPHLTGIWTVDLRTVRQLYYSPTTVSNNCTRLYISSNPVPVRTRVLCRVPRNYNTTRWIISSLKWRLQNVAHSHICGSSSLKWDISVLFIIGLKWLLQASGVACVLPRILVFEVYPGGAKPGSCDPRLVPSAAASPPDWGLPSSLLALFFFFFLSPPQLVPVINLIYGPWAD